MISTSVFILHINELGMPFYISSELNGLFIMTLSQLSFTYVNKTASKETRTITLSFLTFFMNLSSLFIGPILGNLYTEKGN